MAIEIVDLPIKNGGSFHSYVSLPEGFLPISLENSTNPSQANSKLLGKIVLTLHRYDIDLCAHPFINKTLVPSAIG